MSLNSNYDCVNFKETKAKQVGSVCLESTIGNIIFYKVNGKISSLADKRAVGVVKAVKGEVR